MKLLNALITLLIVSTTSANEVPNSEVLISPSSIDKVYHLVNKNDPGSSQLKINVVVVDTGMSTDLSPRYHVYLGLASMAEMGNMSANFKISVQALAVLSARRVSGGIYEVITEEMRSSEVNGQYSDEYLKVVYTIDARPALNDEKAKRKACANDFCDGEFSTHILVTEKTSPLH